MQEDKLLQAHSEIQHSLKALLLPLFAFTLGTFLLVFLTVWYIADEQDRLEISKSQDLLITLLEKENKESLGRVVDYAIWDIAYEKLVQKLDTTWAADNIGQYVHENFPEKRTYVFGAGNEIVYAAEEGIRLLPDLVTRYVGIDDIIDDYRQMFVDGNTAPTGFVYVLDEHNDVWLAAISILKPAFDDKSEEEFDDTPERLHFLVMMRQMNGEYLTNIGKDFGFPGLHFEPEAKEFPEKAATITIADHNGKNLGLISWAPSKFGEQLLYQTLRNSAVLMVILVGLMIMVWTKGFGMLSTINAAIRNLNEGRRINQMYERAISELVDGEFLYELSVYEALQKITVNSAKTLGIDRVTIWRYEEKTDMMHNLFVHDRINPEAEQNLQQFILSEHSDLCAILERGEPTEFYSEAKNRNLVDIDEGWWSSGVPATMLSVPIVRHKMREGIIFFSSYDIRFEWSPEQLRFASLITDIVSLILEVHARNLIEAELRREKNKAEMASAAKSNFLANMSHELRTPLNAIIGFSDIMNQQIFGELGSPQYTEYMKDINVSARHLLSLINDILEVSKHEVGNFELEPVDINLEEEIDNAVRLARGRFMDKKAIVTVSVDPAVAQIEVDEKCFRQITLNLISNSIKFCKGACILDITAEQSGDDVVLKVKDNGIGIPKNMQSRVFEAFSQVEHSLNKTYEGTGLGLAITKSLVEIHGGSITLESEVGAGTTMIVHLPRRQTEYQQKQASTGA